VRRLGWQPGTRLDLREDQGLIVVRADARAAFRISGQGFLHLPSTLRRWCHLADGDRVLLVADPDATWLVIHPPAAVTAMVAAAHTRAWGGGVR
jgi:bifunctional DNA-binding transcriptional regulator/antitoxin component of YhaV-PrlF toxin-antitoxin module